MLQVQTAWKKRATLAEDNVLTETSGGNTEAASTISRSPVLALPKHCPDVFTPSVLQTYTLVQKYQDL